MNPSNALRTLPYPIHPFTHKQKSINPSRPPRNPNPLLPGPHNLRLIPGQRLQFVAWINGGCGACLYGLIGVFVFFGQFAESVVFERGHVFGGYGYRGGFAAEHFAFWLFGSKGVWDVEVDVRIEGKVKQYLVELCFWSGLS